MLNQVHDYLGHVPLDRITAISAEPSRSWQGVTIIVEGDERLELEARGAVHALVAAYEQRTT